MCDNAANGDLAAASRRDGRKQPRRWARPIRWALAVSFAAGTLAGAGSGTDDRYHCHADLCDVFVSRAATQELAAAAGPVEAEMPALSRWVASGCSQVALPAGPPMARNAGVVCAIVTLRAGRWALDTVRTAAAGNRCLRIRFLGHTPIIIGLYDDGDTRYCI